MKYKISEIGKVVGGGTPSTKHNEYYSKNGLAWITPKDLSDYHKKYIGHGAKDISEEGLKHSSAKLLPINSILISSRAPIGYVAMAGTDLATSQGFKSIIPDTSKVIPEFLYYLMLKSKDKLERIASGSTFKEVSGREMSNFVVDIPELKIQKEIVQKLNPISKEIEKNNLINDNLGDYILGDYINENIYLIKLLLCCLVFCFHPYFEKFFEIWVLQLYQSFLQQLHLFLELKYSQCLEDKYVAVLILFGNQIFVSDGF